MGPSAGIGKSHIARNYNSPYFSTYFRCNQCCCVMSSSANSQHSERTPLLAEQQQTQVQAPKKSSASWQIYLLITGIFAFLGIFSYCVRSSLPEALSDERAAAVGGFAGQHAYDEYLTVLTEPRPGSSRANRKYREWLLHTVRDMSNNYTTSVEIDEDGIQFVGRDGILSVDKERSSNFWMVESNNVLVKVIGTRGEDDAYLLSAHYGLWCFSIPNMIL